MSLKKNNVTLVKKSELKNMVSVKKSELKRKRKEHAKNNKGTKAPEDKKKYVSSYRPEDFKLKHLNEPRPVCKLCNEVIEYISSAIMERDGSYSHFDCVIHLLNQRYNIMPPDKISYVGQGAFGIVGIRKEGGFYIKQKIQYESLERYKDMKDFVDSNMEEY